MNNQRTHTGTAFPKLAVSFIAAAALLTGCSTQEQRKAAENAQIKQQAAQEIDRVCALQGTEREAALEKFRRESDYDLYCAQQ